MHIIETIGDWGVKTTDYDIRRFGPPRPGDPVHVPLDAPYPYRVPVYPEGHPFHGTNRDPAFATVEYIEGDEVMVCWGGASCFLTESGAVSISGGPFTSVPKEALEHHHGILANVQFWNWADNGPGADHGVHYTVQRPVFNLLLEKLP